MLSDRRHTRLISEYGGIKKVVPRLTAVSLIITLSSIGLPGMNGFIGEFLIMLGAFKLGSALRRRRRPRRDSVGGLHAVDVPARVLRPGDQRAQPRLPDLSRPRVGGDRPAGAMAIYMGVFPNVFLKTDGASHARDRRAGAGARLGQRRAAAGSGRCRPARTCPSRSAPWGATRSCSATPSTPSSPSSA
jgi:NADH-quinone oxidoreductase subunit M